MNNFFQLLRDIQKKERNTGTLSEIDDTFYDDASKYLQELLEIVNDNPLSLEAYQLRDAQTITTEICERREFKIITTAITNVQKSHNFFKNNDDVSKLYEEVPFNTTPEEEKLYKDVINNYLNHREALSEGFSPKTKKKTETKIGFMPKDTSNKKAGPDLSDSQNSLIDLVDIPDDSIQNIPEKPMPDKHQKTSKKPINTSNKLDASEVAMMFGQAPDDILTDEQNNPVQEKPKARNIMAPFDPPDVPEFDTVSLQNNKKDSQDDSIDDNSQNQKTDNESDNDISTDTSDKTEDAQVNDLDISLASDEDVLVEFIDNLTTDILDENEKTYGPFENMDVALLPASIVKILKINNVVNIIK